jgi:cobalt-precorrin-7 (C5)-methyltransferase
VKIVGIGPGDGRYITPLAQELISDAEVLVGGRRQLEGLAKPNQDQFIIGKDLLAVLNYIETQRYEKSVVVLASGDPGLYSIASYLATHMGKDSLEFIPGISSIQVMFARLKMSWQDVQILSMHGRTTDNLEELIKSRKVNALLTGGQWTPQFIAQYLLKAQVADCKVSIGKDLSYPEERLYFTSLCKLVDDLEDYSNSVMVIIDE